MHNKQNLYWVFCSSICVCILDIFQKLYVFIVNVLASFKVLIVIIVLNSFVYTLVIWAFSQKIHNLSFNLQFFMFVQNVFVFTWKYIVRCTWSNNTSSQHSLTLSFPFHIITVNKTFIKFRVREENINKCHPRLTLSGVFHKSPSLKCQRWKNGIVLLVLWLCHNGFFVWLSC